MTSVPLAPSPYIGSCARTGLAQDRYASFFFFLLWYARRLLAYQSKKKKKEAYRPCRRLLAYQSKKKKKERSISAMPECYENRASGGRGPAKLPSVSADAWCVGEIGRRLEKGFPGS